MKQTEALKRLAYLEHGFYNATETPDFPKIVMMNQVHSADALFITGKPPFPPTVDALVTKTPGLSLAVKTADCAPVLLVDTSCAMIAAVHAGWKGAFQGVLENTIITMLAHGARLSSMRAAIGPHLQQESFEVTLDMFKLFPSTEHQFFCKKGKKRYFDFDAYLRHRLLRSGIQVIESVKDDTFSNNLYFSYRRDPENPGRQLSLISLKQVIA